LPKFIVFQGTIILKEESQGKNGGFCTLFFK